MRDQRDLAALVEAVATTIGPVAREVGFTFRPDACGVSRLDAVREISVLYEAGPDEVRDRLDLLDSERDSCVDLWIYWSPDTGRLDLGLPGTLRSIPSRVVDRDDLRPALEAVAHTLAGQLSQDR